jgi:eukaryotic-like serine/threonine-protein kinase
MSLRVLLIAERSEFRRLVRTHIEIEWPKAVILEHRLGEDAPLDPEFTAAGFDAVVVVSAAAEDAAATLVSELLSRPDFAPIVHVVLTDAPSPETTPRVASAVAASPGLQRVYGRKINRDTFVRVLEQASRDHKQAVIRRRGNPDFERRYRFGSIVIRGHRHIRQVGTGGMCKIYLAESERAGAVVVLKVFSQVPDVSERFVGFDRFLQEYEIVAGLTHRNIVRIYDLGVADDHAYIAMEHFPFGDLRQRMKTPTTPESAVRYLQQIASALDAIHGVGVLHRDLKPANVMLRADGSLCLIDFGLAKANETAAELTGTREIFGTPYYMSPEQGHAEEIDARSDLYSLGVVFYEMLTGRKPYTGTSAMEVIYKHKKAEIPAMPAHLSRFDGVIKRLLAKAPADRFQSAGELLQAIPALEVPA